MFNTRLSSSLPLIHLSYKSRIMQDEFKASYLKHQSSALDVFRNIRHFVQLLRFQHCAINYYLGSSDEVKRNILFFAVSSVNYASCLQCFALTGFPDFRDHYSHFTNPLFISSWHTLHFIQAPWWFHKEVFLRFLSYMRGALAPSVNTLLRFRLWQCHDVDAGLIISS